VIRDHDRGDDILGLALGEVEFHGAEPPASSPGHFAIEVMPGLSAVANRPNRPFQTADLTQALSRTQNRSRS
jgi:hypothetical protein